MCILDAIGILGHMCVFVLYSKPTEPLLVWAATQAALTFRGRFCAAASSSSCHRVSLMYLSLRPLSFRGWVSCLGVNFGYGRAVLGWQVGELSLAAAKQGSLC